SKQRNAGIAALSPEATLAGYLDDDLVLEDGCIQAMLSFWESATDDVGGAAFNIVNERSPRGILVKSLFYVDGFRRGAVLRSGYQSMLGPVPRDIEVDWLSGGVTVWRRQVTQTFEYDEWFQGTGYLEDVDFSYRVSRKYRLFVLAGARIQHLSPPVKRSRDYLMGKWQAINRMYFVRKHPEFSRPLYYWATFGLFLANVAEGIATLNYGLFLRAAGNIVGLTQVSSGRLDQLSGYLKRSKREGARLPVECSRYSGRRYGDSVLYLMTRPWFWPYWPSPASCLSSTAGPCCCINIFPRQSQSGSGATQKIVFSSVSSTA